MNNSLYVNNLGTLNRLNEFIWDSRPWCYEVFGDLSGLANTSEFPWCMLGVPRQTEGWVTGRVDRQTAGLGVTDEVLHRQTAEVWKWQWHLTHLIISKQWTESECTWNGLMISSLFPPAAEASVTTPRMVVKYNTAGMWQAYDVIALYLHSSYSVIAVHQMQQLLVETRFHRQHNKWQAEASLSGTGELRQSLLIIICNVSFCRTFLANWAFEDRRKFSQPLEHLK